MLYVKAKENESEYAKTKTTKQTLMNKHEMNILIMHDRLLWNLEILTIYTSQNSFSNSQGIIALMF